MRVPYLPPIAAAGVSAVTVAGAVAIMIVHGSPNSDGVTSFEMSTGVPMTTGSTVTDAPKQSTTVAVPKAAPTITGTAELPKEEQGLPGR